MHDCACMCLCMCERERVWGGVLSLASPVPQHACEMTEQLSRIGAFLPPLRGV